ncbi:MAG: ferrous iron transport protein B [Gemmatimonadetes bacterium]|nr:ferrous iron transport protein B [Gemmatimonadota bacterium]MBT6146145.1 ferrous iron transport protein B [Gemmatimonadota bacterium]MBT7864453.1 ferrous iron transport protein B [Gemmatimonadota bacterium]
MVGNPNTGKTTLFNALTGLSQRTGNYPGVTVEYETGQVELPDLGPAQIIDLPGTYSLSASSPDEAIAVDVLLGQQDGAPPIDIVIAIADASNLRRHLYLLSQVLETGHRVVLALNMADLAQERGIEVDIALLSERLAIPVVPLTAHRGTGIDALLDTLKESLQQPRPSQFPEASMPQALRDAAAELCGGDDAPVSTHVEAMRVLVDVDGHLEHRTIDRGGPDLLQRLQLLRQRVPTRDPLSAVESEARYTWISQILNGALRGDEELRPRRSDRIDRLLTHRVGGLAVFLLISALTFQGIFTWSAPLMDAIDGSFGQLGDFVGHHISEGPLRSMVVDGVISGVGGVLIFLPQIAILFLIISLLEDCGYMARAAMMMDRLLRFCGLSGRSFIPMLSSFACAVPGILAARGISDRRDRYVTILVAPLMSCSARLPVYVLFIAAFIPDRPVLGGLLGLQGLTLLAMYGVGAGIAIPMALLLRKTLLKGRSTPFLIELPSYKWPVPKVVLMRVYLNCREFIVRAGSIILAATIIMWALAYYPHSDEVPARFEAQRAAVELLPAGSQAPALAQIGHAEAMAYLEASYLGRAGHFIEPAVRPLGWDWRLGMAALASFPARELIISTLGTIFSLGSDADETSEDLRSALRSTPGADGDPLDVPVALSVMVFFALCAQCTSTLAVIRREMGSWKWMALSFGYMTTLAYAGAWLAFTVAEALGWGTGGIG